jgi:hypothetical protein
MGVWSWRIHQSLKQPRRHMYRGHGNQKTLVVSARANIEFIWGGIRIIQLLLTLHIELIIQQLLTPVESQRGLIDTYFPTNYQGTDGRWGSLSLWWARGSGEEHGRRPGGVQMQTWGIAEVYNMLMQAVLKSESITWRPVEMWGLWTAAS